MNIFEEQERRDREKFRSGLNLLANLYSAHKLGKIAKHAEDLNSHNIAIEQAKHSELQKQTELLQAEAYKKEYERDVKNLIFELRVKTDDISSLNSKLEKLVAATSILEQIDAKNISQESMSDFGDKRYFQDMLNELKEIVSSAESSLTTQEVDDIEFIYFLQESVDSIYETFDDFKHIQELVDNVKAQVSSREEFKQSIINEAKKINPKLSDKEVKDRILKDSKKNNRFWGAFNMILGGGLLLVILHFYLKKGYMPPDWWHVPFLLLHLVFGFFLYINGVANKYASDDEIIARKEAISEAYANVNEIAKLISKDTPQPIDEKTNIVEFWKSLMVEMSKRAEEINNRYQSIDLSDIVSKLSLKHV